jgi:hypothetical protein
MELVRQKCTNHPGREAVVRCPGCAGYYCRECVTEHEGKFLCSSCIHRRGMAVRSARRFGSRVLTGSAAIVGVLVAWFLFYTVGRLLILIPPNLHGY